MVFFLLPDNLNITPRCTAHESTLSGARSFVLDNGIFSLSILPEYGGRICSLYYRPLNLELLATEFIPGDRHGFIVRGGWFAAFPSLLADGEIIGHSMWNAEITEQTDDAVAVRLSCRVDRLSHQVEGQVRATPAMIQVERHVRMVAGEPVVTVEEVLTNLGIWPAPTTWSAALSLRAQPGDRAVLPVEQVEVMRGVGPTGNELDFGLLSSTPYQALAPNLREGWLGFRPAAAPVDVRLSFPHDLLPHAVVMAQRDDLRPAENAFRFQPIATPGPIAEDARDRALILPPKKPMHLPLRLEVGPNIINAGEWSRPGLQLANIITEQQVPNGRFAVWRVGEMALALKTHHYLLLLLPEMEETAMMVPEDLPAAHLLLYSGEPARAALRSVVQRTTARIIGPGSVRQMLRTDGVGDDRSVALSPGARFDLRGLDILATPAREDETEERIGFLLQADHLSLYHTAPTQFLGEFGPLGTSFHPQLVFLPVEGAMTQADALHAAKQLKPRVVVPLGSEEAEHDFIQRARAQHMPFAVNLLRPGEGRLFDGWHLHPLA